MALPGRGVVWVELLAMLPYLGGCRGSSRPEPIMLGAELVATAEPGDDVVATVEGRPIHASAVALQARAKGSTAGQALDDLIVAELLAGEAARRGLASSPEVERERKRSQARRLLAEAYEKPVTPSNVPMEELRRAYRANSNLFDHDELVEVWHILSPAAASATPATKKRAFDAASEVARRAPSVRDAEAFKQLAKPRPGQAPLKLEHIVTAKDGWTVKPFSRAAFELQRAGDTSPVVETSYGYHVIYLVDRIAPVHRPLEEVEGMLRGQLFPSFQRREFVHFVDQLAARHQLAVYPERLPPE